MNQALADINSMLDRHDSVRKIVCTERIRYLFIKPCFVVGIMENEVYGFTQNVHSSFSILWRSEMFIIGVKQNYIYGIKNRNLDIFCVVSQGVVNINGMVRI